MNSATVGAILILVIVLGAFLGWLYFLVEALRIPYAQWKSARRNKWVYVVLMVLGGPLGTVIYFGFARAEVKLSAL